MPIATIPMLNGKVYAVWDATLIQSAYRNRNLSFIPFALEFGRRELRYDDATERIVQNSGMMEEFFDAMHKGFSAHHTNSMNVTALSCVATQLDGLCAAKGEELVVPNAYLWARDLMTEATCVGLFGSANPFKKNSPLLQDVWCVRFSGNSLVFSANDGQ